MTKIDLGKILKEYREANHFTLKDMGRKLDVSTSSYERLEKNKRKATHEEVLEIAEKLNMKTPTSGIKSIPDPPRKWYQSSVWRWVIPIFVSYVIVSVMMEMRGFRAGYGEQKMSDDPPIGLMIITSMVFCTFYWYFYPPQWPCWKNIENISVIFKRNRKS